jgi:hypothetical protein
LLAVSGGIRLAIGALWLELHVRLSAGKSADAAFRSAWRNASRLQFLFAGAELYRNRFGRNWREMLLLRLLRQLDRAGLGYKPAVRITGLDLLLANATNKNRIIVVTMHSPVDAVLNRVFREHDIDSSLLVDRSASIQKKAQLLGLKGELDTIGRTSDALLIMRRKLGEGRLICACVDFTWPSDGSFYVDLLVSPAMFELARSLKASLIYAEAWVAHDGHIEVALGRPGIDVAASTADTLGADFIAWLQRSLGDRRAMRVMKWQRKARRRSGLLKLPAATARPDQKPAET